MPSNVTASRDRHLLVGGRAVGSQQLVDRPFCRPYLAASSLDGLAAPMAAEARDSMLDSHLVAIDPPGLRHRLVHQYAIATRARTG